MICLVDSSVYIHGFRDADFGEALRDFHRRWLPSMVLSAVVVHELLVGAATSRKAQSLQRGLVEPFRARRRLTENMDDFGLISSVLDIRCVQPWPDWPLDQRRPAGRTP